MVRMGHCKNHYIILVCKIGEFGILWSILAQENFELVHIVCIRLWICYTLKQQSRRERLEKGGK